MGAGGVFSREPFFERSMIRDFHGTCFLGNSSVGTKANWTLDLCFAINASVIGCILIRFCWVLRTCSR